MKPAVLAAALALAAVLPARAQAPVLPPITDDIPIFCKGDSGEIEPMKYSNFGAIVRRFKNRFQFDLTIQQNPLVLTFSDPASTPYSITYQAQPYRDDTGKVGIAFLSMHLFLENADRDQAGTPMCYFTEFGK